MIFLPTDICVELKPDSWQGAMVIFATRLISLANWCVFATWQCFNESYDYQKCRFSSLLKTCCGRSCRQFTDHTTELCRELDQGKGDCDRKSGFRSEPYSPLCPFLCKHHASYKTSTWLVAVATGRQPLHNIWYIAGIPESRKRDY